MAIDLYYSDIHLREDRLELAGHVFDRILEKAEKHDVIGSGGTMTNCGDMFNVRGLIHSSCFDLLYEKRKQWRERGVEKHDDITGNHDQEDVDGKVHPMKVFTELGDGWRVFDEPYFDKDRRVWYFPYMRNLKEVIDEIPSRKRRGCLAVVHAGIHGAFMNNKKKNDRGIPIETFKGFKKVFAGHYHKHHSLENIIYVGSPNQQDFREIHQPKGVVIHDRESGRLIFSKIVGTPRHHEVQIAWDGAGDRVMEIPDGIKKVDKVWFRIKGPSDLVKTVSRKELMDLGLCSDIKIERKTKDVFHSRLNIKPGEADNVEDLSEKYVDYMESDLDRDKLVRIGKELLCPTTA